MVVCFVYFIVSFTFKTVNNEKVNSVETQTVNGGGRSIKLIVHQNHLIEPDIAVLSFIHLQQYKIYHLQNRE